MIIPEKKKGFFLLKNAIDKGITLDLLFFFTTKFGTSKNRSWEEIISEYEHISDIGQLVKQLIDLQLLSEVVQYPRVGHWHPVITTNLLRLSHDILAPIIKNEYLESNNPGQVARRILEQKIKLSNNKENYLLNRKELYSVTLGKSGMRIMTDKEMKLMKKSQQVILKKRLRIYYASLSTIGLILFLFCLNIQPKLKLISKEHNPLHTTIAPFSMALSDQGVFVAAYSDTIHFVLNGELLEPLLHPSNVRDLVFFNNGKSLLSIGIDDPFLVCWDLDNKSEAWRMATPDSTAFSCFALSSDENRIALGDVNGKIWIFNIKTQQIKHIKLPKEVLGRVEDIDYFHGKNKIAFCHHDGDCGIGKLNLNHNNIEYFNYPEGEFNNYKNIITTGENILIAHYIGEPVAANHLTVYDPLNKSFKTLAQNSHTSYQYINKLEGTQYIFASDYDGIISFLHIAKKDRKIVEIMGDNVKLFYEGSIKGIMNKNTGNIVIVTQQYIFRYRLEWSTFFNLTFHYGKYF